MSKYGNKTHRWFESVIDKMGGEKRAKRFLLGELILTELPPAWTEKDGVIYCSVTSDGKTGPEWVAHFEKKDDFVDYVAKHLLCSSDFVPTTGITYQVVILKGMLWNDKARVTRNIRSKARRRQLVKSHAEIACLIRDKFTDADIETMGLFSITTMHKAINNSDGDPCLLSANRHDYGRWLSTFCDDPDSQWSRENGFAFVVSQVSTQS